LKGDNTNTGGAVSGTNQTSRWNILGGNTNVNAGSSMTTTSAGSYTPGWNSFSTAQNFSHAVIAIREAISTQTRKIRGHGITR
jgi:hypothetical protein